jgi:hypothetical protein
MNTSTTNLLFILLVHQNEISKLGLLEFEKFVQRLYVFFLKKMKNYRNRTKDFHFEQKKLFLLGNQHFILKKWNSNLKNTQKFEEYKKTIRPFFNGLFSNELFSGQLDLLIFNFCPSAQKITTQLPKQHLNWIQHSEIGIIFVTLTNKIDITVKLTKTWKQR